MTLPIDFDANPLVPAVIQDDVTRDVLMVGFMNRLAFEKTQETGFVHFWSRSRNQLWKKGETSGHTQEVVSVAVNCEDNSLLIQVIQNGAVCHTGHTTCYYRQVLPDGSLFETSDPVFDPAAVYQLEPTSDSIPRESEKLHDLEDTSLIQAWYGAYEYLAQQPLQGVSGTSKLLHEHALPLDRIADELEELAGVLAGEHSHHNDLEQDVVLEGSQVLYWLNLLGIGLALRGDQDLDLGQVFFPQNHPVEAGESIIEELRGAALLWRDLGAQLGPNWGGAQDALNPQLLRSYSLVARAVSPVVPPFRLIEHDLDALRAKPYLADYFAAFEA